MEVDSVVAIAGLAVTGYFAWRETREMIFPRAAKWLLGLAGLSVVVGLAAAWQVDRSNAGVHPEWIGMARRILSVETFVSITLFSVAIVLVYRATKQAEENALLPSQGHDTAEAVMLPAESIPDEGFGVPTKLPEPRHRSDR